MKIMMRKSRNAESIRPRVRECRNGAVDQVVKACAQPDTGSDATAA